MEAPVQRHVHQLVGAEQTGAHAVVDVVCVVGHLVGQVDQLRLQRRLLAAQEALAHPAGFVVLEALGMGPRTMLEDALARLEGEVQAVEARMALLQQIDDTQALQVVLEAAMRAHALVQRVLSGMAEGRVAQVVRQRDGFDQVFIELQLARHRTRQLRHFQRMRQPRAEQVAFMVDEDLRLVDQPAEGGAMHDAFTVDAVGLLDRQARLVDAPPARAARVAGPGGE